jgi:hypothetical protein
LKTLTSEVENVQESDLEKLAEKFPRGGVIAVLTNHPELHSDCKLALSARTAFTEMSMLSKYRKLLITS